MLITSGTFLPSDRRRFRTLVLVLVLLVAPFSATWQIEAKAVGAQPRFVVVVLDETGSFAKEWDEMLRSVSVIASRLGAGEGMVVIGMDDAGFQPDDVRIEVTMLDEGPLKARVDSRRLVRAIQGLRRRDPKRPYTDVLGAVRHAAYFLDRYRDHDPKLIVFSDLRQTPRPPTVTDAAGLSFPDATAVSCFYVDATGYQDWRRLTGQWETIFTKAGAKVSARDFHQKGETAVEVSRIFPRAF